MKASKQLSIVLAATVLAFGVATLAPQQADASYGYKYTDSIRPPVLTPTPSTGRAPVEPVATTVTWSPISAFMRVTRPSTWPT